MLMQQDQYKFVLCTYNTRDSQPRETLPLDDFNVDYLNDEEGKPLAKCSVLKNFQAYTTQIFIVSFRY